MNELGEQPTLTCPGNYILRPFRFADAEVVVAAGRDPHIPLITTVERDCSHDEASAYIQRQRDRPTSGAGYSFAIAEESTDRAVGQIGVWFRDYEEHRRITLGFWVVQSERGKGIASLSLAAATRWALDDLDAIRCQAFVEPWNAGSWRAAERVGYEREGLLRRWQRIDGIWRDLFAYAIVRE